MMKKLKLNHFQFVILASLLLGTKVYFISRFQFDLAIANNVEEFILILHSLGTALFFGGIVFYFSKEKNVVRNIVILHLLMTFILYANLVYYRFFNDFITVPVLFQVKNFSDLGGSALGLMNPVDLLLFVDIIILAFFVRNIKKPEVQAKKKGKLALIGLAAGILLFNLSLAETQRPQLLTRIFDRKMVVKYLGVHNYHLFDLFVHSKSTAQRTFAEGSDVVEVENFLSNRNTGPNEFTGIAKDKNVILIALESLQSFVIDYKINGEEVTPFLNDLVRSSIYFDNFYHQTGQGKSSDSEFLIDTSLYPLGRGAVFTTNSSNKYFGLPGILGEHGYTSATFHGNNKSFWNRDIMYQSLGYDHFFDETYYDVTPENSVNYGLKDIPFFKQSIPMLKELPEPYLAKFITLTNHYPYLLDDEDKMIEPTQTGDGSVDRYFQTARYLDEAVKIFFEDLKKEGIYKDSIIILYGDHYGISENHNRAMSEIIGREITPFEHVQLQRVPLIIHIPGMEPQTISKVSGQIDLKPTILNMLGIEVENDIQFGMDLFADNHRGLVILRDGSFVTDSLLYTNNTCHRKFTKVEIDTAYCQELAEDATTELILSDKVVQGDLLRFIELN